MDHVFQVVIETSALRAAHVNVRAGDAAAADTIARGYVRRHGQACGETLWVQETFSRIACESAISAPQEAV